LGFEKREILLIVGVFFLMIGTMAFLAPIYSVAIAVLTYFGIRSFVKWRKREIKKALGQGICAACGTKIVDGKCPNCDEVKVT
jgi:membrane protein implicated in regulation of membrane protease activity